jgi:hypothetical protein
MLGAAASDRDLRPPMITFNLATSITSNEPPISERSTIY